MVSNTKFLSSLVSLLFIGGPQSRLSRQMQQGVSAGSATSDG
jgi:hypothetical protein